MGSLFPNVDDHKKYFWDKLYSDWKCVKNLIPLGSSELNILFHFILRDIDINFNCDTYVFTSENGRKTYEEKFDKSVTDYLKTDNLRQKINDFSLSLSETSRTILSFKAMHDLWPKINAKEYDGTLETLLWRLRLSVSFEHFTNKLSNNNKQYPLLNTFLEEEENLEDLLYLSDILAWHKILFENVGNITREEASEIKNIDIVNKLVNKQMGIEILDKYCVAFNKVFCKIERIYECQDNPFLTADKKVDLSGTKTAYQQMDYNTPIVFSLPTNVRGENDLPSMCTIQIINHLQGSYNKVYEKIAKEEIKKVFPISLNTDSSIIKTRLINYNRQKYFIPLISRNALQPLNYGEGTYLDYDFEHIENSLRNGLFSGKIPLLVQITNFIYKNTIKIGGSFNILRFKVPQTSINDFTKSIIYKEVDTIDKCSKILSNIEISVNLFLALGVDISGDMLWKELFVEVLLLDNNIWNDFTTSSINKIRVKQLIDLYQCLEEKVKGDPLDGVFYKYRDSLSDDIINDINSNYKNLNIELLLVVLKELLISELSNTDKWSPTESLKIYLEFTADKLDIEIDTEWYNSYFPITLQLKHTYHTYKYLQSLYSK